MKKNIDLCIILISHLKFDNFLCHGLQNPLTIAFSSYTREQAISILTLQCPPNHSPEFFKTFVALIYDSHIHACRDISEHQYLVLNMFPKYYEPIAKGKATESETSKLFKIFRPIIKDSISSLFLRQVSSFEFESSLRSKHLRFELPRLTKFLVIAGYLASYNPSKLDQRYFTKGGEGKKKVSKKGGVQNGSKKRQQLIGPKSFGLERMLAIFYSIADGVDSCYDIQTQVLKIN
jgi:origin recognition complex subunit 5